MKKIANHVKEIKENERITHKSFLSLKKDLQVIKEMTKTSLELQGSDVVQRLDTFH